jgi:pyruvate dehydrogenase E1 component alpha subunit
MTVLDHRPTAPVPGWLPGATAPRTDPAPLLPDQSPVRMLDADELKDHDPALLLDLYRRLVVGRRYNQQATTLTKQGRLAVYPSSTGQEACQVAAATVLRPGDWLFPSYRDTLAVVGRGVDPLEALTLLRGNAHTGYDPRATRTAPLCTPLATQAPHAVGLAHAARLAGDPLVALAMMGDGGTSEGDFHEALNFAAVLNAPVVFLVQNNGYAISVPLSKQSAAPTLAHKAVGYGMRGRLVDGNDVVAVHTVLAEAMEQARTDGGPTLVEALTYRLEAHTNADDATRYRESDEVTAWQEHDPLLMMERQLRAMGLLDDAVAAEATEAGETLAARMRAEFHADPVLDPMSLFQHVYAHPTPQLLEQQHQLAAELAAEADR